MPEGLPPPSPEPTLSSQAPEIAVETVKLIAELAAKEYANENDVQKSLDTKTATWIGATGAVLIFTIGTLGKIPTTGAFGEGGRTSFEIVYILAIAVATGFLAAAEVWFIFSFRTRIYRVMNVEEWTTFQSARLSPVEAYIELAGEYNHVITGNRDIGQRKARTQRNGIWCFIIGLVCLMVVLALNLVATW